MKYFTEDLEAIKPEILLLQEDCKNNPNDVETLIIEFNKELIEVNRFYTIEKYIKTKSKFYRDRLYNGIINTPEDKISKFGIGMREDTFAEYIIKYNEEFELI